MAQAQYGGCNHLARVPTSQRSTASFPIAREGSYAFYSYYNRFILKVSVPKRRSMCASKSHFLHNYCIGALLPHSYNGITHGLTCYGGSIPSCGTKSLNKENYDNKSIAD